MITIMTMIVCYILIWIAFFIGYRFVSIKNGASMKFKKYLWNSRIDKMQYPPFTWVMKLAEKRNPIIILLVIVINSSMVITEMLLGLLMVGPLFLLLQGFMVGALIAQADKKTQIFSFIVLIFELGSFATSCGLGLYLVAALLFNGVPILENVDVLIGSGLLWIPVVLLILNGLFEGSGVLFGIEGVPGIRAVREKLYK